MVVATNDTDVVVTTNDTDVVVHQLTDDDIDQLLNNTDSFAYIDMESMDLISAASSDAPSITAIAYETSVDYMIVTLNHAKCGFIPKTTSSEEQLKSFAIHNKSIPGYNPDTSKQYRVVKISTDPIAYGDVPTITFARIVASTGMTRAQYFLCEFISYDYDKLLFMIYSKHIKLWFSDISALEHAKKQLVSF